MRLRERRLRAVVDHCPIPLFLKDTQGRYLLVNKAYQAWYALQEGEIIGGSLDSRLPPARINAARQRDREVLETGATNERELSWTFPDGVTRTTIGSKFPVYDDAGETIGIGGVQTDVTTLRATQNALGEARQDLERINRELEARVKFRTHELASEVESHKKTSATLRTNEAWLRLIMDSLPFLIAYVDRELRYKIVNKTGAAWYARPVSEIIGKHPSDIFGQNDEWENNLKSALKNNGGVFERNVTYPDGVTRDIRIVLAPHYSANRTVSGLFLLIEDITSQKTTERERLKNELLLRSVVDNAPALVNLKDMDNRYLIVNKALANAYNVTPAEMVGKKVLEKVSTAHATASRAQDQKVIDSRQTVVEERDIVMPNGDKFEALVTKFPVFDNDGVLTSIGTFNTDVSLLKAAEKTSRAALKKARDANKSKQLFLANMSHDLRTPLNAIIGFSEIMRMEIFGAIRSDRYRGYIIDISQSAKHLLELVDEILDLSKIESGNTTLSLTTFNIADVAATSIKELQPRIDEKSLTVTTEIDQGVALIFADPMAVRQMLTNLLTNAVKFTLDNGVITVRVAAFGDNAVRISVSDTGIGIPTADMDNILTPFGQVREATISHETGSGLGLSIVSALAALHGGEFHIESEFGVGTYAHITLPQNPSLETRAQDT